MKKGDGYRLSLRRVAQRMSLGVVAGQSQVDEGSKTTVVSQTSLRGMKHCRDIFRSGQGRDQISSTRVCCNEVLELLLYRVGHV